MRFWCRKICTDYVIRIHLILFQFICLSSTIIMNILNHENLIDAEWNIPPKIITLWNMIQYELKVCNRLMFVSAGKRTMVVSYRVVLHLFWWIGVWYNNLALWLGDPIIDIHLLVIICYHMSKWGLNPIYSIREGVRDEHEYDGLVRKNICVRGDNWYSKTNEWPAMSV